MTKLLAALAALCIAACASTPAPSDHTGRIYHYVRTNLDGTLPEHVYVYREAPDRVAVYKMVEPCTNAALVTGVFDLASGEATQLTGGRLNRQGGQDAFAYLTRDREAHTVAIRVNLPDRTIEETEDPSNTPWRQYDFDLADFEALASGPPPRADFSFGFTLIWTAGGDDGFLRDMGRADAHFAGAEQHLGHSSLRYDVSGAVNGPLWLDAREGHVVEAAWAEPNHAEYESFRLQLQGVDDGGPQAWRDLLAAHWAGCPQN